MAKSLNRVTLVGNLTRDPELHEAGSTSVCQLRIAVNGTEKRDGEWVDRADYFDVKVWGNQGESCAKFLSKGRQVAVDGRLRLDQWEKDGEKRSAVRIVADTVQFIGSRGEGDPAPSSESAPKWSSDDDIPW